MDKPPSQKAAWVAPLAWGAGALAVVAVSVLAMHQGANHALHRPQELQAASALKSR